MKICSRCGTPNVDAARRCEKCYELLLDDHVPSKNFPVLGLILMEGVAFLLFVFSMYVYRASDFFSAIPYFSLAFIVAVISVIGSVVIHKKRISKYNEYVQKMWNDTTSQQKEHQEAVETGGGSYLDTLAEIESKMKARRVVRSYDELSDFNTLAKQLAEYFALSGYEVSQETFRMLTVAMASSRLVYLDIKPRECAAGFVEILNRYFGFPGHVTTVHPDWNTTYALLGQYPMGTKDNRGTGLLVDLYMARYVENNICCTYLDEVDPDKLSLYFYDFEPYVCNPTKPHIVMFRRDCEEAKLVFVRGRNFQLPGNMWFFAILGESHAHKLATKEAYNRTVKVQVNITPTNKDGSVTRVDKNPFKPVSYSHFNMMVSEFYEEYLLPEEMWCRWDKLMKYLNEEMELKLGNSNELTMENLSSMYMAIFSDWTSDGAMDFALSTHILPKVRRACEGQPERLKALHELTEGWFGEGALPVFTQGLLRVVPVANLENDQPASSVDNVVEG